MGVRSKRDLARGFQSNPCNAMMRREPTMNTKLQIDINCDLGEGAPPGHDEALLPLITSCNVAGGMHAGDAHTIQAVVKQAIQHGVQIGAHPSYPDREGFGRRKISMQPSDLRAIVKEQILTVKGIAERHGVRLVHVKPHGALYNSAADSKQESRCILEAMAEVDPELILVGLAGSVTERVAREQAVRFVAEAFADRRYTPEGRLLPRSFDDAVIDQPDAAAAQVISIVRDHKVTAQGADVSIDAQTVCVHGDNVAAQAILEALDSALAKHGILKACF